MKATGIVRRIDNLGRLVIPKEVRKTLHIRQGDSLEIFVDREGEVILKSTLISGSWAILPKNMLIPCTKPSAILPVLPIGSALLLFREVQKKLFLINVLVAM